MNSYFTALRRSQPDGSPANTPTESRILETPALVRLPVAQPTPALVARSAPLQRLCEQLSPLAVIDRNLRIVVSGCRPEDGASTVAAALALDLSQRLAVRTLLLDANLRHPTLHRTFAHPNTRGAELMLDGPMQVRSTGWSSLDLGTCCLGSTDLEQREALKSCNELSRNYTAVVIDLGVARLDARMLPLARDDDPILLVVRYGHTRRQELATTAAALRGAKRTLAGVILNAAAKPVAHLTRKTKHQ